ncbi:MAG: AbrB family transcriptional regulator [Hyphomicrobiaceae bacterium]
MLTGRPGAAQWSTLLCVSAAMVVAADYLRLPAALMVGPMVAAILVACANGSIRMSQRPFIIAQGVIGVLVGNGIPLSILDELAKDWPLFAVGIVSVIIAASAIGYVLTRMQFLPGTTAIWGTSPGASTAMIVMSEAYGADVRLVAVMQYLRVAIVIGVAALVAKLWTPAGGAGMAQSIWAMAWLGHFEPASLGATLALAVGGALLAQKLRIPAGPMLLPMVAAMALHGAGLITIVLPPWLLAMAYALIGWSIGLRFTRPILAHAFRAMPRILASIAALIAMCGLLAAALVWGAGIDPLTAYLATSPGGADSIAIIAASAPVNLSFVLAMQTSRLAVVLVVSPLLSRYVAEWARKGRDTAK